MLRGHERIIMPVGAGQSSEATPQTKTGEVKSPIPGVSPELFNTLSQRHSLAVIQEQQAKYDKHKDFLKDAEKEAEHIRATQVLDHKPLSPGQVVNGKIVDQAVLDNAALGDEERKQAAAKLLYGEDKKLSEQQQKELIAAHEEASTETGLDEEYLAGVYNLKREQIRRKVEELPSFTLEERRKLFEAGLVGKLTAAQFAAINPGFNPNSYTDPEIKPVAGQLQTWGQAGNVDEVVAGRVRARITKLNDDLKVDPSEAEDLDEKTKNWEDAADNLYPWFPRAEKARVQELARQEGGSEFSMTKCTYEYYMKLADRPNPVEQQRLIDLRDRYRTNLLGLLQLADQIGISDKARTRGLEFYKKFKRARRRDKWGRDKQELVDYGAMQSFHEDFWTNSATLKPYEDELRGAAKYLFDGIVAGAYKELENDQTPHLNVVGKEEFLRIQERRIRGRKRESLYDTNNYYGRISYELAAENAPELPDATWELTGDRLAAIPDADMETTDRAVKEIMGDVDQLASTNRIHLQKDEEQPEVNEDNPYYKEAKAGNEILAYSVGYEKIIGWEGKPGEENEEKPNWENGGEVAASYVKSIAAGYIAHHNAMYLRRRVARILLKLRTHKEGTYWLGHPFSEEKVDFPAMQAYRGQLQKEIMDDAATHELFITDQDFDKRLERKLGKDGKPERALDGREIIERDLRYSFDDPIERLLLDSGDVQRAAIAATGNAEALKRHDMRIKIFRDIKTRRDTEDGFAGLSPAQRQDAIRLKIIDQMKLEFSGTPFSGETRKAVDEMNAASGRNDRTAYDKAMWAWLEKYNRHLTIRGLQNWYPSNWDLVRMKIDRPEKLVDRKLTDEQLDAMYEEVQLNNLTEDERTLLENEVKSEFMAGRDYAILEMEDALYGGITTRMRDPKTGKVLDPSHMVRRIFDIQQERVEKAITEEWNELENLKSTMRIAIDQAKRAHDFKKAKELQIELDKKILDAQFLVTHALKAAGYVDGKLPVWCGSLRGDKTINFLGDVLAAYGVNVAFAKKISHNSKDWLYEILERGRRGWQSEKDIAVEEFMEGKYPEPEVDYDSDFNSPTYGQLVPQYEDSGKTKVKKAKEYRKGIRGEGLFISERNRIVGLGSPNEHQQIVDPQYNNSTSGGQAVLELTGKLADFLFDVPMVKFGAPNLNAFHGVLRGLDEVQALRMQRIFTANDALNNATERIAAYATKRSYSGGKNAEGKSSPGFANEPWHGGFKAADWLHKFLEGAMKHKLRYIYNYVAVMQQGYRQAGVEYSEFMDTKSGTMAGLNESGSVINNLPYRKGDVERLRQLSYEDLDGLTKPEIDDLNVLAIGIMDYFEEYLKARKGCIQSRGGRALRSWEEENLKSWYVFRRKIRAAVMGQKENGEWVEGKRPEQGFILRLGYSPEVANEAILRIMEGGLVESEYVGLFKWELDRRLRDGEDILFAALTHQETREGFEVTGQGRVWVVPDQKDWPKIVRPEIRKALENIRRRGLLEFMLEEGYTVYEKDSATGKIKMEQNKQTGKEEEKVSRKVLGQKLPPLVQDRKIKEDPRRVKNAFNPILIKS